MTFPTLVRAEKLRTDKKIRLFISAYGSEERSLGWVNYQDKGTILNHAIIVEYINPKGVNLVVELRQALAELGISVPIEINYNTRSPHEVEDIISNKFEGILPNIDEVIVDISSMTKLLILICLCKLENFSGTVRIVYSEAEHYVPTQDVYDKAKGDMKLRVEFPSRGFESIIRAKCLSSIRMQGQPVILVAFTAFNEQLVSSMLGTMNPHRLLFINGHPPRKDYAWRENATQEIHKRLIEEYEADNPVDDNGRLKRVASTLDYRETIDQLNEIYKKFGIYERIICAATGSKMQTVGLFFSKIAHPDIHIEYPTPDSYYITGPSTGIRKVHEIVVPRFSEFLKSLKR